MRIIITDDDKRRSSSLENYLISAGVVDAQNIYHAENVDEALKLLVSFHFDVMILDVVIPQKSHGRSDSKNGISLLNTINRSKNVLKPSKIIGITAHLEDLGRFRKNFEKFCLTVIEANRQSVGWKKKLADYIGYDNLSQAHRNVELESLNIITIHGIRTFGVWQQKLRHLVQKTIKPIPFHSYKYGYASPLALLFEFRRKKELDQLSEKLISIFDGNKKNKFILFSHSFGTYLAIESLRNLSNQNIVLPVRCVVLSGSVLPSDTDLNFLFERNIQVINDCAESDYVLWLSEAFVPNLGMAGRTGFYGFENKLLCNRYFTGGHSTYFEGDDFMMKYWIPLISSSDIILDFDSRQSSTIEHDLFDRIISFIGRTKRIAVFFTGKIKKTVTGVFLPN